MSLIDLSGQRFGRLTVLYRDIEEEKKEKRQKCYMEM